MYVFSMSIGTSVGECYEYSMFGHFQPPRPCWSEPNLPHWCPLRRPPSVQGSASFALLVPAEACTFRIGLSRTCLTGARRSGPLPCWLAPAEASPFRAGLGQACRTVCSQRHNGSAKDQREGLPHCVLAGLPRARRTGGKPPVRVPSKGLGSPRRRPKGASSTHSARTT